MSVFDNREAIAKPTGLQVVHPSAGGAGCVVRRGQRSVLGSLQVSESESGRDSFRGLFERVTSDGSWLREASETLTEAIHQDLPDLDRVEGMRERTHAAAEGVLRQLAELIELGQAPAEVEPPAAAVTYAREFVRRGVPIDTMLRAYHVGQAAFFADFAARLHAELDDGEELAHGIELAATWTFAHVQALTRVLVARYSEERERWVRSADALRLDTVTALLAGERLDLATAGRRLRYELDREHLAFVVWGEGANAGEDTSALESAAVELAGSMRHGSALIVPLGHGLVACWLGTHDAPPEPPPALHSSAAAAGAAVAFGTAAGGPEGFAKTHRQALHARRVAVLSNRRSGTVTRFNDIALTALASLDPELVRDFVAAELGPLAATDDDTLRLSATLRVYLEEQGSPRRTAQRLGIHENTVKHRVKSISQIFGRPADERSVETLVALRLVRVAVPDKGTSAR